ncbi:MAG: efflux RND transporter periplasmic adaptor subunit [Gemmatimonadales bacterium]
MNRGSLLLPAVIALIATACGSHKPPPISAVPVSVAPVRETDFPVMISSTGTVEPIQTTAVQAQVSGLLIRVAFKEGDDVTAGQVLFEIDPRPFQAALDQTEANLTRDAANWSSAERDVARNEALAAKDYVTQQQLDQSRAAASALAGTLRADSAAIEQARLNVQYATIKAPISGRAGSVLVREGNQVRGGANQTLVVINQISPILVRFPVPAAMFDDVRRSAAERTLDVSAAPVGDSTTVEHGSLVFLDNAVDTLTGTVSLKARFDNPDRVLWPGALERVALQLEIQKNALVVPAAAVQSGQSGDVIWTVDAQKRAHLVHVHVERTSDTLAVLAGGVTAGELVVTDGQLRLTDSARVNIKPASAQ